MNLDDVKKYYNLFNSIQNSLSEDIISSIWPNDREHFFDKWLSSDNNIILFISKLDDYNQNKLLEYFN
jgi:hypothetical protein